MLWWTMAVARLQCVHKIWGIYVLSIDLCLGSLGEIFHKLITKKSTSTIWIPTKIPYTIDSSVIYSPFLHVIPEQTTREITYVHLQGVRLFYKNIPMHVYMKTCIYNFYVWAWQKISYQIRHNRTNLWNIIYKSINGHGNWFRNWNTDILSFFVNRDARYIQPP